MYIDPYTGMPVGAAPLPGYPGASSLTGGMNRAAASPISLANQQQLLRSDPRLLLMQGTLGHHLGVDFTAGGNASMLASSALNSDYLRSITGGSRVEFAQGINSGMVASGRMFGTGELAGKSFQGAGSIMEQFSGQAMRSLERDMFNSFGGANLGMTRGFDRDEMGRAVAALGQSGAFAGQLEFDIQKDISGNRSIGLTDSSVQNMKNTVDQALSTFKAIEDVMGDASIEELSQIAQTLGGGGAMTEKNLRQAKLNLKRLTAVAANAGVDQEEALNTMMTTKANLQAMGVSSSQAGFIAQQVTTDQLAAAPSMQTAAGMLRQQGFEPGDRQGTFAQNAVNDAVALQTENKQIPALMAAVEVAGNMTEKQREDFRERIASLGTSENKQELRNNVNNLVADFNSLEGVDNLNRVVAAMGGDPMAMLSEDQKNQLSSMSTNAYGKTFQISQFKQRAKILAGGDENIDVENVLGISRKNSLATLLKAQEDGGIEGANMDELNLAVNLLKQDTFASFPTEETEREARLAPLRQKKKEMKDIGRTASDEGSFLDQLSGSSNISDEVAAMFAAESGRKSAGLLRSFGRAINPARILPGDQSTPDFDNPFTVDLKGMDEETQAGWLEYMENEGLEVSIQDNLMMGVTKEQMQKKKEQLQAEKEMSTAKLFDVEKEQKAINRSREREGVRRAELEEIAKEQNLSEQEKKELFQNDTELKAIEEERQKAESRMSSELEKNREKKIKEIIKKQRKGKKLSEEEMMIAEDEEAKKVLQKQEKARVAELDQELDETRGGRSFSELSDKEQRKVIDLEARRNALQGGTGETNTLLNDIRGLLADIKENI